MSRFNRGMRVIVAACTLGFIATTNAAGIDACKLISADQASRILNSKITAHTMDTSAAGPDAGSMCNYAGKRSGSGFMLIAAHIKYTDAAQEVASRQKEALEDIPPGLTKPGFTSVKGLGDAAYLATTSAYFQLHVLAHGSVIVINRNTAATTKAVEQTKELARAALARLK